MEAIAAWSPDDTHDGRVHRAWARELSNALASTSLPGGYANLLGPDEHEQIGLAYGSNIDRLREIKRSFDPSNFFSAIPLP